MLSQATLAATNVVTVLLMFGFISACDNTIKFDGIEFEVDEEIGSIISIESATLTRSADHKQLEAKIMVTNNSSHQQLIVLKSEWFDDNKRSYGTSSRQFTLLANEKKLIVERTRASSASQYRAQIVSASNHKKPTVAQSVTDSNAKIAEGYGMTYSVTVRDEKIPALPIFGTANREPFSGKTVVFAQRNKGIWWLEISDEKVDPWYGPGIARHQDKDLQSIHIELKEEPTAGKKIIKDMSYGGGYFQIKYPKDPSSTTSWNTEIAYRIEIEKWEKGPSVETSCSEPAKGNASGKLFISFKGSDEPGRIANSFVSGQFKDIPIVYCGK